MPLAPGADPAHRMKFPDQTILSRGPPRSMVLPADLLCHSRGLATGHSTIVGPSSSRALSLDHAVMRCGGHDARHDEAVRVEEVAKLRLRSLAAIQGDHHREVARRHEA